MRFWRVSRARTGSWPSYLLRALSWERGCGGGENTQARFFGETRIFIYPGYHFIVMDVLVTNFHLPEFTLIMLVSAFVGYRHTLAAYLAAVV